MIIFYRELNNNKKLFAFTHLVDIYGAAVFSTDLDFCLIPFFFCLKDFLNIFRSERNKVFQLWCIWKRFYFTFVFEMYFWWVKISKLTFSPSLRVWSKLWQKTQIYFLWKAPVKNNFAEQLLATFFRPGKYMHTLEDTILSSSKVTLGHAGQKWIILCISPTRWNGILDLLDAVSSYSLRNTWP